MSFVSLHEKDLIYYPYLKSKVSQRNLGEIRLYPFHVHYQGYLKLICVQQLHTYKLPFETLSAAIIPGSYGLSPL